MNLSERLAKAAMERGRVPDGNARRVQVTRLGQSSIDAPSDTEATSHLLPGLVNDPIDAARVTVMQMRLPDPASLESSGDAPSPLPLWERPLVDLLGATSLATVTTLPLAPFADNADDDYDGGELAQTIQMPGMRMPEPAVDVDLTELYVPPLAATEAQGLAKPI